MTKDELIEQLASRRHTACQAGWTESGHEPSAFLMGRYLAQAEQDWPLIVAFVAEWLLCTGSAATFLSEKWREEMA